MKINSIHDLDSEHPDWERFVRNHPLGQYQQTGAWGRYKRQDGWQPKLLIAGEAEAMEGGYLLLVKNSRIGRVGYVAKGPLAVPGSPPDRETDFDRAMDLLGLSALIVQPPDSDQETASRLESAGFRTTPRLGVIDSTLLVPVSSFHESPFGNIRRTRKQAIRRAMNACLEIREGTREELPVFFELLRCTCSRQRAGRINPSSLSNLEILWDLFVANGYFRLTFARDRGNILAALLCIVFGDRLTLWKKGWTGDRPECHPNELLYFDAISWARDRNLRICDFAGLDRGIAEALLRGEALTDRQANSRDIFNLSFGGVPQLLPKASVKFRSRYLGKAFDIFDAFAPNKTPPIFS